jgi:hypothetical protein
MRFMLIGFPEIYRQGVPHDFVPPVDGIEKMDRFHEELQKAGVLLDVVGLQQWAVRVSFDADGKSKVTDGPFAEAKEAIGGYVMIQVKSREDAIEWARRTPITGPGDVLEVRQLYEPEVFLTLSCAPRMRVEGESRKREVKRFAEPGRHDHIGSCRPNIRAQSMPSGAWNRRA